MKKTIVLLPTLLLLFGLSACHKDAVTPEPTSLTLNQVTVTLKVGETTQLIATVEPKDQTYTVTYTSDKPAVATVDAQGLITAVAEGTATVTASVGKLTQKCVVTVSNSASQVKLEIKTPSLTIEEGQTAQIEYTVIPADTLVTFTSEDPAIATVDNKGLVSALKEGSTKVNIECGSIKKSCSITVSKKKLQMKVEVVDIDATSVTVKMIPPAEDMRYFCNIYVKEAYDKIIDRYGSIPEANRKYCEAASSETAGGTNYRKAVEQLSLQGTLTKRSSEETAISGGRDIFPDNHEIVLLAYGVDPDGFETTEVLKMVLKTKPRVNDPSFKIEVNVTNTTVDGFKASVKPSDPNKQYFIALQRKSYVDQFRHPADDSKVVDNIPAEDYMVFEVMNTVLGGNEKVKEVVFRRGNVEVGTETFNNIKENRDYVFLVWGWDDKNGRTTDVYYTDFKTNP